MKVQDIYLYLKSLSTIDDAIKDLSDRVTQLGAAQNRLESAMDAINTFTDTQINEVFDDFCYSYELAKKIWGDNAFKLKNDTPLNMILFELSLLIVSLTKDSKKSIDCLEKIKRIGLPNDIFIDENIETPFECNLKYHRDSKENFEQRISWIKETVGEIND